MRRLILLGLFFTVSAFGYKGSWKIDDTFVLYQTTANPSTGAVINTATPTYRVYEDTSNTALVSGSYSRLDSTNTDSLWRASITLSAANGFEKGKNYAAFSQVVISAATYESVIPFQVEAEVDANIVSDKLDYNVATIDTDAITATAIQADAIGAAELAANSITSSEVADGAIDAGALAADTLTAAKVATDAITSDEIAASAVTEIQSGLSTFDNTSDQVIVATNNDKLDYNIATLDANAITAAAINTDAFTSDEFAATAITEIQSGLSTVTTAQVNTEVDTAIQDAFNFTGSDVIATLDGETVTPGANTITASVLATDSITNDEIAASAVTEIQSGLATAVNLAVANASLELIELADINGTVDAALSDYDPPTRAELTSDINSLNDLSSAQVAALIAAGTADIIAVSDEFGSGGGASAGAIADAVWDEAAADHNSAGTMGNKMNSAASAGDPWSTALPGAYGTGTAGEMLNLIWEWVRNR